MWCFDVEEGGKVCGRKKRREGSAARVKGGEKERMREEGRREWEHVAA